MGLGSDGGGAVRYPAALTGLIGLKPQRDRVPLGPEHASGWHGLIALGPLTRSVRDAALFLQVAASTDDAATFSDFAEPNRQLTIALSTNPPPGSQVSLSREGRKTIDDAADLLAGLGHKIVEADIDYGMASLWNSTVRLLKGTQADVASLSDRRQLEPRTRTIARFGRALPGRSLRKALAREQDRTNAINKIFDAADVVPIPVCEAPAPLVANCPKRGALRSPRAANTSAWLVPWNLTGQPGLAIPTGVDDAGLPTAIQLVGKPWDESTLLTLAAQIERQRPFPRPPKPRAPTETTAQRQVET